MPITTPFDGAVRRRIYLMRHAEAAYRSRDGATASDPNQVALTELGRRQAAAARDALAGLPFEYALCSNLPRTRETAEALLERGKFEAAAGETVICQVTSQQLGYPLEATLSIHSRRPT